MSDPKSEIRNPKFRDLLLISLICLILGSIGITWGLPSSERNKLYFSDGRVPDDIPQRVDKPFEDYPEFSWDGAPRASNLAVFNPIRSYHPDEYIIFKALASTNPSELDFNTDFYGWPSFFTYTVGIALKIASLFGLVKLTPDIQFYFRDPAEMAKMYVVGRAVVLFFSIASVCLLYCAAKNLYDQRVALFSSLLLCVLPIFVVNQHYMTADIPMVAFACAGLFFVSMILTSAEVVGGVSRRPPAHPGGRHRSLERSPTVLRIGSEWYRYILAGISLGLAFGMKYQGALLIASIPLAHFLKYDFLARRGFVRGSGNSSLTESPESRGASRVKLSGLRWVVIACGAWLIAFCIVNPYHILNFNKAFNIFGKEVGVVSFNASGFGVGHLVNVIVGPLRTLVHGFGVFPLLFIIVGSVCAVFWRERADILLLGQFILVYIAMGIIGTVFVRHYVPLLPVAVLLCARAIFGIADKVRRRNVRKWFLGFSCFLAFVPALAFSAAFVNLCRQENVRTTAGKWIVENVAAGSEIGAAEIPWQYNAPPLDLKRYEITLTGQSIERFKSRAPEWFIASSAQTYWAFHYPELLPKEYEFWRYVMKTSQNRLVERFEMPAFPLSFIESRLPECLQWIKLENAPEDMTYPNPTIFVFRRATTNRHE